MLDPAILECLGIEEPLVGIHLDHAVADRGAAGEHDSVAGVLLVEVAGLHVEIERPLAPAGLDAGHSLHLTWGLQVLVSH